MQQRDFKVHKNFAEADEADYAYYRSLSGNEKLEVMLEIMGPAYEANPRLKEFIELLKARGVEYLLVGGWISAGNV